MRMLLLLHFCLQVVRADDPKPKGLGRKSTGSSLLDCP